MHNPIIVHKGRTMTILARLGVNVSGDTFSSDICSEPDQDSTVIASWDIDFETDGTDGVLVLTMDNTATAAIVHSTGYMDIKRTTNGEPISVFDGPIPVTFRKTVTV